MEVTSWQFDFLQNTHNWHAIDTPYLALAGEVWCCLLCVKNQIYALCLSMYCYIKIVSHWTILLHYISIIMSTMASQITSLTNVYSTIYSAADQRKHQSSASLALVGEFTGDRWIPHAKGQQCRKCFHLMTSSWFHCAKFQNSSTHIEYIITSVFFTEISLHPKTVFPPHSASKDTTSVSHVMLRDINLSPSWWTIHSLPCIVMVEGECWQVGTMGAKSSREENSAVLI